MSVAVGGAVEFACVPEVAACFERRAEGLEDLGLGDGRGASWEACVGCVSLTDCGHVVRFGCNDMGREGNEEEEEEEEKQVCDVRCSTRVV